jgi:glutamine---fructose-6-phosphate transaminase (isomerizing)
MTGIIAARVNEDAAPYLLTGLGRLAPRGYDSAGLAVRTLDRGLAVVRSADRIPSLRRGVDAWTGAPRGGIGIAHTRWASSGEVSERNAHPHLDCTGRIAVVHNGEIENAVALRELLVAQGHAFRTDTDSEVIVHLVERALAVDPDVMLAVQIATAQLQGSWAVAVLDAPTGRLVVAADGSPLVVARSPLGDFVASDVTVIAGWVESFVELEDGDVAEIGHSWTWSSRGYMVEVPPSHVAPRARLFGAEPAYVLDRAV